VAISDAVHCHLKLPFPPFILGFNHEPRSRNAPIYQISTKSGNFVDDKRMFQTEF